MKHHSRIKRNELLIQSSQTDLQTQCILNQNLNRGMCMGIIKTGKVILKLIWEYKGPKRTKEVSKKRKAVAHALICEKSRLTLKLQQLRGCSISTETDKEITGGDKGPGTHTNKVFWFTITVSATAVDKE